MLLGKDGADRLAWHRVETNLQFVCFLKKAYLWSTIHRRAVKWVLPIFRKTNLQPRHFTPWNTSCDSGPGCLQEGRKHPWRPGHQAGAQDSWVENQPLSSSHTKHQQPTSPPPIPRGSHCIPVLDTWEARLNCCSTFCSSSKNFPPNHCSIWSSPSKASLFSIPISGWGPPGRGQAGWGKVDVKAPEVPTAEHWSAREALQGLWGRHAEVWSCLGFLQRRNHHPWPPHQQQAQNHQEALLQLSPTEESPRRAPGTPPGCDNEASMPLDVCDISTLAPEPLL